MADDLFVRRSAADYAEAMADLLPTGPAWDRDPESALMQLIQGLSGVWAKVDGRAADLLFIETDPRYTRELLSDWERAFGLPDPCIPVVQTLPERRAALVAKITMVGAQSRTFFLGIAASLGYPSVTLIDTAGDQFRADTKYLDANTIVVTLGFPAAGKALLN